MPEDAEQVIARAVQRGAISESRAGYWRTMAASGHDVSILDVVASVHGPQPVHASAPGPRPVLTGYPGMAPPAGADPIMFAANPVLDEMRRDQPALVAAAEAEGPAPELFGDRPLPAFTASGLPPEQLASLAWPLRRPVAQAPTLAKAYELVDRFGSGADADMPGLLELRYSRANADYLASFSAWLTGPRRSTVEAQLAESGQPRHPRTGQYTQASQQQDDYTEEQLYRELFPHG